MSGIGIPAALSDHIDRSKVAFWECCHCLKLNAINDSAINGSASGRCFSCHFQSQGSGHCRNSDHPRLRVRALSALRLAQRQRFYPFFVDPTVSNQHRQIPEEGNYLLDAYRKVCMETDVEIVLSAHVICGDCRLLNGYKEYLIFAHQKEGRFVKGGVLWSGVNAKLLEWQQHNRRAPTPVEKAALLDEFEEHISKQFKKHSSIKGCWRTIERFKRYRAKKVVDKSSLLGNRDPNPYPECDMERTKRIMQRDSRAKARFAMGHGQASVALMFRQKERIMRDHGYFRDTRLVYKVSAPKHHRLNFQGKPSPLRQCSTRQDAKTDHRLVTVGYVNRERARSTNTAEEDEVEAEAYQQRFERRHADVLQQCEAAFQRLLADL
ncbi:hypothetical protein B0T13DRAFT_135824 [Neurospora crassa]|nr:hypothetical protein B0T13DRAFT_135824 [Neurospora crassa]